MTTNHQAEDESPAITVDQLEHRAGKCYECAGRWLASTFTADLIGTRRDALATAERWAARGLECQRQARRLRRATEESAAGSHHG